MNTLPLTDKNNLKRRIAFYVVLSFTIVSLIGALFSIWHYLEYQDKVDTKTKTNLQAVTVRATQNIEATIKEVMRETDAIANDITAGKLSKTQMLERIKELVLINPNYFGSTISYRPYGFDPSVELYAPYYCRSKDVKDSVMFSQLEEEYDYTSTNYDWFVDAMKEGNRWGEPYWGPAGNTFMITYSAVFYDKNPVTNEKTALGVVTLDIEMDYIKDIIENADLGESGFGALVSKKGIYLYHPNSEYVVGHKTILEVAKEKKDADRLFMAKKAAKGEGGIIDHISTTTHQESWLVFAPVPITGWSLQNTFIKEDIKLNVDNVRRQLIWIVLQLLIFILLACACAYFKTNDRPGLQWIIVAFGSLFIVISIGLLWSIALRYNPADKISGVKVSDVGTLKKSITKFTNQSKKNHSDPPIFVPTGLFIDAVKFSGPSDVLFTGYIWQKYDKDFPKDITKEFMISKATNVTINEVNRTMDNGSEIIQYQFEAEIRQSLSAKTYPLEEELLEIRLIHKGLNNNVILVPDLDAYKVRSASQLPGLDESVFISGWKLSNAYYGLRRSHLNSNFGISQNVENNDFPVLYYNIAIQRDFIDAFISNLTPLIIVSIMLFFLLMVTDKIDTSKVFSTCIAMFFVIVFSHIDIRGKISAQEIFYLEYFFFLTYGLILYVALNSIGVLLNAKTPKYKYNGRLNLLLFWPVVLGIIFLVTVFTFF